MGTKAKGKQGRKVTKVQGKAKRAEGTVAKLWAMFDSMKDRVKKGEIATADVVAEAIKRGYTKSEGTCKTQFQWWRAENGIKATFKRPKKVSPAVKKAAKAKAKAKVAAKKPAPKKPAKPASKKKPSKAKTKPVGASAAAPAAASTPAPASTTPPPSGTAGEGASTPAQ